MKRLEIHEQKQYCGYALQSHSVCWPLRMKSAMTVLFVIILLSGCKTSKTNVTSGNEILKTEEIFFSSVLDNSLHFNTLTSHLKFELTTPDKNLSSRAVLKMRHDAYIQVSMIPFLGIEAFRIELTKDSVKLMDRLNKRYMTESYDKMKGKMAVDFNFNNLQALLSNSMFIPGKEKVTPKEFRLFRYTNSSGKKAEFSIKDATGWIYRFAADSEEKLLSTTVKDNSGENTLKWVYDDFQKVGNTQFPMKMTAQLQSEEKNMGTVRLSFSEPEINTSITADFKIPAGYRQVTFSQFIKSLEIK
ncbi:MAG: DUF4292 domain-containing protein [Tannerella sp.]|jgi:PBP1b-binding outer membrane lipoprotein LpoB|nr:DUF4292 domain-containing protein [Tannerella sp.]